MKFLKSFFFPLIYFLTSQSSHAKETISSVSWQDNIDQFFGEFIVAPLAEVEEGVTPIPTFPPLK